MNWKEIMHTYILENSLESILIAAGVILFAFLLRKFISSIIANLVLRLFKSEARNLYKNVFKKEVVLPLARFLFWFITFTAIEQLQTPYELKYRIFRRSIHLWMLSVDDTVNIINFFALLIGIKRFALVIWKHSIQAKGDKARFQLVSFIGDLIDIIVYFIGLIVILKFAFKRDISGLMTNLSLITAALALAAKESVENIIASFIIFLDKPFYVGDFVKLNNISGTVERIGLRSTRLRTADKSLITVPNKQMVDSILDNVTYGTHRRYIETLELSLDTSVEKISTLIASIENILISNADLGIENHVVYLKQTGTNAHIIYLEYLVNARTKPVLYDYYQVNGMINTKIVDLIKSMQIAYAQASSTVINIQQPLSEDGNTLD